MHSDFLACFDLMLKAVPCKPALDPCCTVEIPPGGLQEARTPLKHYSTALHTNQRSHVQPVATSANVANELCAVS